MSGSAVPLLVRHSDGQLVARSGAVSASRMAAAAGTAIAIGVLLDTLLVRTVLAPAALIAIGDRIWWPGPRPVGTGPARDNRASVNPRSPAAEQP